MAKGIASTKDTARMMVIDGEKLRSELKKRGLKQREVSEELGCSDSYISYSVTRNIIAKQTERLSKHSTTSRRRIFALTLNKS